MTTTIYIVFSDFFYRIEIQDLYLFFDCRSIIWIYCSLNIFKTEIETKKTIYLIKHNTDVLLLVAIAYNNGENLVQLNR